VDLNSLSEKVISPNLISGPFSSSAAGWDKIIPVARNGKKIRTDKQIIVLLIHLTILSPFKVWLPPVHPRGKRVIIRIILIYHIYMEMRRLLLGSP
jgi:hypothetical protein